MLARAGLLEVHVFALNFRQVHVLAGPAAGRSTQAPPIGGKPYLIIGRALATHPIAAE
jgi:hypothetical protein